MSAPYRRLLSMSILLVLYACGGGGGSGVTNNQNTGTSTAEQVPTSGSYVQILTLDGNNQLFSAAHPSFPTTEYAWSDATVSAQAAALSYTSTIDSNGVLSDEALDQLTTLTASSMGSVSLKAGGRPVYTRTSVADRLCRFLVTPGWLEYRLNFDTAHSNLYENIVAAGRDNLCDTSDDVYNIDQAIGSFYDRAQGDQAEIGANGIFTVYGAQPASYAGNDKIEKGGTTTTRRSSGMPYKAILNADAALLFEDAHGLFLLQPIKTGGSAHWNDYLLTGINAQTGWQAIGYDNDALYLYRNSSASMGTGSWEVLKVSQADGSAATLGTGHGTVKLAILGQNQIWLTDINGSSQTSTQILFKNGSPQKTVLSSSTALMMPVAAGGGRMAVHAVRRGFSGIEVYEEKAYTSPIKTIADAIVMGVHGT